MAGLGRRTHYRKHLTDSVMNDLPEPKLGESIAIIVATRGSNQFDVRFPHSEESQLAILPAKFRKLVWLKRNDYVIVQTIVEKSAEEDGEDHSVNDDDAKPPEKSPDEETAVVHGAAEGGASEETGSIRCMVTHILYSDQIKNLRTKGIWPTDDPGFAEAGAGKQTQTELEDATAKTTTTDGIVYDTGYGDSEDDDVFVNTNRISKIAIQDDSSSEEEN
mmetsp:Transcript_5340/g.6978  ORF Transcript_5340/g.6978 Transcript_5340/m.6978 type:complete len:219 (-) Transcript_5340:1170-1826(-)|eukprot:CAMPEP_0198141194 /NCGR_PEP_ID=MMETSP1443-20131203/4228_1 /TAXON_ID=186043 /ORGANISM="Entomoneis sp., Strain CCMP2396" /LENGTH=218 /DNA_ID=CAMNT_0043803847 /DNA_START=79 /DNA_END=738 /DNA_ORIENTATION=+